ncbi:hypothetical protein SCUP515_00429 [Seiridium cupressi]
MAPTLFHKKSKVSLRDKPITVIINDHGYVKHSRSMSTTSSISTSSSTLSSQSKSRSYDPLSLHPPLSFNTSPVIQEDEEEEEEHQNHEHQSNADYDDLESPLEYYFNQDKRRRTYVYDQNVQWPLKDWQSVPPGLATTDDNEMRRHTVPRTDSSSSTLSQRRPLKETMSPLEAYVKRGEWKRRGIVFGLDETGEDEQTKHFEVNPLELAG